MSEEQQLITTFYTSFQSCSWQGMVDCYHPDIFFYDPVFGNLDAPRVRAMWEMLLSRAQDLTVTFANVTSEPGYGACDWVAVYTFSATGRKVTNTVKARFTFSEGKIIEHYDDFDVWKWSAQALGTPGRLFGWTPILKNSIRRKARTSLEKFMAAKPAASL